MNRLPSSSVNPGSASPPLGGSRIRGVDLFRTYRVGREKIHALAGLTMEVEAGEFVAITGPSGSGKSTLLHLIGGLDRPTSGEVWVDDLELGHCSEQEQIHHRRNRVGFVFQRFHLLAARTALENVVVPMILTAQPRASRQRRARLLLERMGLQHRLGHRPSQLSAGEQQRVAIARALANRPSLLLTDEPTGNLDSRTGRKVMELLLQMRQQEGLTVIVVTHDAMVASYADRILKILDGRITTEEESE